MSSGADKDVGKVLRGLIREKEISESKLERIEDEDPLQTSFGVPLVRQEKGQCFIDMTGVKVFAGLSTFIRLLINDVIEQCVFGIADVMVRRKIDAQLTPELHSMGIEWVMLYARADTVEDMPSQAPVFERHMHTVFNAIQSERWGGLIFPEYFGQPALKKGEEPPALYFPFHLGEGDVQVEYFILIEFSKIGHFLRVTIEDAGTSRLQMKHIRHHVVDKLGRQAILRGIQLIALQIHQGILRECRIARSDYKEYPERQPELFDYLGEGGFKALKHITFQWPEDDAGEMILEDARESITLRLIKKSLHCLQDPEVRRTLIRGDVLNMKDGFKEIYLDLSRRGACLNISFSRPRVSMMLDAYLENMPNLWSASQRHKEGLANTEVFLVHHITAEVIGLIKAFEQAGCSSINTFFVKYAGVVPDEYLESLLSLPEAVFQFHSLQKIESRESFRGRFALSREYSSIEELEAIDQQLEAGSHDFFSAMRLAAGHLFLLKAVHCYRKSRPLILVEDGGYLAPLINRSCLENRTVGQVFETFHIDQGNVFDQKEIRSNIINQPFADWLEPFFVGSIEHTRNGYDYNQEVVDEFGRLQFPVCSIAVSLLKRGAEARECSNSILNAIQNILNHLGLMMSRRQALILGSRGAIASNTFADFVRLVGQERVCGVDSILSGKEPGEYLELETMEEVPKEFLYDTDLVIGIIGKSIMKRDLLEDMVIHGKKNKIFFTSGSTKTVEFQDLEEWLQDLIDKEDPFVGKFPVSVQSSPIRDLQTGVLQGHRVDLIFKDDSVLDKELYLLGDLTPINFLYYGIPREIIDEVMTQLFTVCLGLYEYNAKEDRLPGRLLAVDHEIDCDGNLI